MKAVILVGGEGTRLQPLTCNTPKAMVPVLNTPFLEHVIGHLGKHGVKDIVLAMRHLAGPIESYLGDGSRFGVRLHYSVEDVPLGSAGAVKYAERYLDETFLVLNGDIFADLDFAAMTEFHREREAKATIALTPVDDPTSYGLVETSAHGRVTRFLEKPGWSEVTTNMVNAGAWLLEPDVLAQIPPQVKFSFERETFPQLLAERKPVYAYHFTGYWMDVGTPEKYLQLHRDLLSGKCSHYTPTSGEDVRVGEGSKVHPAARIKGPAVIGDNCTLEKNVSLIGPVVIGDGCTILEGTTIEDAVIWHDVQVGPRATVKHSVVAENCCLNENCSIEGTVLGDNVTVASDCKVETGSKIWPAETVSEP